MKILVLMKEVPDMTRVEFDREKGVVNRAAAPAEINPFDLNALEEAVKIKEEVQEAEISVLTMGPPAAEKSLREAYARGADRVFLMTDRKFGGADTLATSQTLVAGIRKIGSFDLILCGEKSVDGDTAQVGPEVAELLDISHACFVEKRGRVTEKSVEVECGDICGKGQIRRMPLPALLSVTKNINTPRLPTVDRKLSSFEIEITRLTADAIQNLVREEELGAKGSPTRVKKIVVQELAKRNGKVFREDMTGFFEAFAKRGEALRIGRD